MNAMAEELKPHRYHPSILHMGDCSVCGNVARHQIHNTAGGVASSLAEELKIQDDANDILTRRVVELEAECARKGNDLCIKTQRIAELEKALGDLVRSLRIGSRISRTRRSKAE